MKEWREPDYITMKHNPKAIEKAVKWLKKEGWIREGEELILEENWFRADIVSSKVACEVEVGKPLSTKPGRASFAGEHILTQAAEMIDKYGKGRWCIFNLQGGSPQDSVAVGGFFSRRYLRGLLELGFKQSRGGKWWIRPPG